MRNKRPSVQWYLPSKNKPIAYSTIAVKDSIEVLSENNKTIKQLLFEFENNNWIRDKEIEDILKIYIDKGFGNISLDRVKK